MRDSNVSHNWAPRGGVFSKNSESSDIKFELVDSLVRGNVAAYMGGVANVYSAPGSMTFKRSTIIENRASAGGVVYAYDYNYGSSGDVHIQSEDSLFEHNSAASSTYRDWENHGGVHYPYGAGAKSYSSGDRFDNNSATDEGGVSTAADASERQRLNVPRQLRRIGGVLSVSI